MNKELTIEIVEYFLVNPESFDLSEYTSLSDATSVGIGRITKK